MISRSYQWNPNEGCEFTRVVGNHRWAPLLTTLPKHHNFDIIWWVCNHFQPPESKRTPPRSLSWMLKPISKTGAAQTSPNTITMTKLGTIFLFSLSYFTLSPEKCAYRFSWTASLWLVKLICASLACKKQLHFFVIFFR